MTAVEARREYRKAYRQKNAEKINANLKKWREAHPEKIREYEARYWVRKAASMGIASAPAVGVIPEGVGAVSLPVQTQTGKGEL